MPAPHALPRRSLLTLAVLGVTSVIGLTACSGSSPHQDVSAFAATAATSGVVLVDVRTADEFAAGHLQGATNVDMQASDFVTRMTALGKDAHLALYCHSGRRSGEALDTLTAAGFTQVVDLSGGITAWQSAGRPLVTG